MATGLNAIDWGSLLTQSIYWLGIIIIATIFIAIMVAVTYVWSFPYKITYWPVVGSGQGLTVDRAKKTRIKWSKDRTHWITLWPLFNKKKVEPFGTKYIYPGRNLYAFRVGDEFIPANIGVDLNKKDFQINPIPYSIRNWQIMELKQNEIEFSHKSWWDDNKMLIGAVLAVAICCGLAGVTIYYTYSFAAENLASASANVADLAQAVREALTING